MLNIKIVDEIGIADPDTFLRAVQYFAPLVKDWNATPCSFTYYKAKPKEVYVGVGDEWVFYITERNRHASARAYHDELPNGNVVAYVSFSAYAHNLFGRYHRALVDPKTKKVFGHDAFMGEGLITGFCHELAEALADPKVRSLQHLATDTKGRTWLVEICDPVSHSYILYTDPKTKVDCVLPDFALPSFYDVKGAQPYSLAHAISSPFTLLTPYGYANEKRKDGTFTPIK